jgi:hypothetical protein
MTDNRISSARRVSCFGIVCLWAILFAAPNSADARNSRSVRGSARRILSSREFRNMKPLKRKQGAPKFNRTPPGEGEGRSNQSNGGNGEPENNRGGNGDGNNGKTGNGELENGKIEDQREFGGENDDWQPGEGNDGEDESANGEEETSTRTSESSEAPQESSALGKFIGGLFQVIGWIFIAVIVGVMVFMVVKGIMSGIAWYQNRDQNLETPGSESAVNEGELEPETSPAEIPADVYVTRARELAGSGKYRDAVSQLLLGAMSNIERAGLIRFRKGLTYRDYTRAVRGKMQMHQSMRTMVKIYEPLGFGRRVPTESHFEESLSGYMAGFRGTQKTK